MPSGRLEIGDCLQHPNLSSLISHLSLYLHLSHLPCLPHSFSLLFLFSSPTSFISSPTSFTLPLSPLFLISIFMSISPLSFHIFPLLSSLFMLMPFLYPLLSFLVPSFRTYKFNKFCLKILVTSLSLILNNAQLVFLVAIKPYKPKS